MRRILVALAVYGFSSALCLAQQVSCGVVGVPLNVFGGWPFMSFSPVSPDTSHTVAAVVGMTDYNPIAAVASVHGNTIDVTLSASYIGLTTPPALSCKSATFGPVPAGLYVVNLFVTDPFSSNTAPILAATGSLAVGVAPSAIPTLSPQAVLALATLMLGLAWANKSSFAQLRPNRSLNRTSWRRAFGRADKPPVNLAR